VLMNLASKKLEVIATNWWWSWRQSPSPARQRKVTYGELAKGGNRSTVSSTRKQPFVRSRKFKVIGRPTKRSMATTR